MSKENKENGRVRIDGKKIINNFDLYDKIPIHHCSRYQDALVGNWQETPLSNAFFSKENMVILQNGIRAGVYAKSENKYVIGLQDCDTLRIVMRSIFLQYSANMCTQLTEQLTEQVSINPLPYYWPPFWGRLARCPLLLICAGRLARRPKGRGL